MDVSISSHALVLVGVHESDGFKMASINALDAEINKASLDGCGLDRTEIKQGRIGSVPPHVGEFKCDNVI
jgi:hypothetical protein